MADLSHVPAELRNMIYEALLSESQRRNTMVRFRNDNAFSIFAVSKQFHYETTSYFYKYNTFNIYTPSRVTDTATILPPIANRYLRHLRQVRVLATIAHAESTTNTKVASTIASLATIGANLEDVLVIIESSLSRLINSVVDDSILGSDHPVTTALRTLLDSGVAKTVRLCLCDAWLTSCVAHDLKIQYGNRLLFVDQGGLPCDTTVVQREKTGVHITQHMGRLGLSNEDVPDVPSPDRVAARSTPSSISSSLGSAFADLDTFSVTNFERGSDDVKNDESRGESTGNDSFFSEADIQEWEASTESHKQEDTFQLEDMGAEDDLGDGEELGNLSEEDFDAVMGNMEDVAYPNANEDDITYMTNFAPELLLARHHLGHLV
jgi:hypothetical protein